MLRLMLPSLLVLLPLTAMMVHADVTLNGMFKDNMVLQRGMQVPVWGWAAPGEQITVSAAGQAQTATADADGKWMVRLDPIEVQEPFTVAVSGNNEIVLQNVVMGDVWICSGQSNMAFAVARAVNGPEEVAAADYPLIRLCQVPRITSEEPLDQVNPTWAECTPESAQGFSAVGYFFGRELHQELGVPIGLISTNWGGTPAEAWTSAEKLENDPDYAPVYEWWANTIAAYPTALETYQNETLPAWEARCEAARAAGQPLPTKPTAPMNENNPRRPSNLYNAMIHPLIPYAIKGAIWYQGESNAHVGGAMPTSGAWQYRELFPTMIQDWRERWGQGDFPFAWVSLANYRAVATGPEESQWAELRESQTLTLALPNTGQALAIDVGEADDIHPKDKQTVGHRLALWALDEVHDRDVVSEGPSYQAMRIEGNRVRLSFTNAAEGLRTQATVNAPDPAVLQGFQVAGEDRAWVWAQAQIDGDEVLVWADGVAQPVAVRYAWANNPVANLYNSAGLPAVPFRTDDWPLTSQPME